MLEQELVEESWSERLLSRCLEERGRVVTTELVWWLLLDGVVGSYQVCGCLLSKGMEWNGMLRKQPKC